MTQVLLLRLQVCRGKWGDGVVFTSIGTVPLVPQVGHHLVITIIVAFQAAEDDKDCPSLKPDAPTE